ncbi:MAG: hypothetical protein FWG82_03780 [Oscillospiraceae bacterium]|nr:hypothetical protein [Oscillospiraceae bacterium]
MKLIKSVRTILNVSDTADGLGWFAKTKIGRRVIEKSSRAYYATAQNRNIDQEEAGAFAQKAGQITVTTAKALNRSARAIKIVVHSICIACAAVLAGLSALLLRLAEKLFPLAEIDILSRWLYIILGLAAAFSVAMLIVHAVALKKGA